MEHLWSMPKRGAMIYTKMEPDERKSAIAKIKELEAKGVDIKTRYDLVSKEYQELLANRIQKREEFQAEKQRIMAEINALREQRSSMAKNIEENKELLGKLHNRELEIGDKDHHSVGFLADLPFA